MATTVRNSTVIFEDLDARFTATLEKLRALAASLGTDSADGAEKDTANQ